MGYKLLQYHIKSSHEKDTQILFYTIQNNTNDLLSKLMYKYTQQKDEILKKHQEVKSYLSSKENILDLDLTEIKNKINKGIMNTPYNIYITDENYVIKNTTYKPDLGFNLSFAKDSFEDHYKNNVIGVSTPIFEKTSKNFFSFSDSYIIKNGKKIGILQVSYNYPETKKEVIQIRDTIDKYPTIKDAKAYIIVNTGFVNDLILKDFPAYKPTLAEIEEKMKRGTQIKNTLKNSTTYTHEFTQDSKKYKSFYFSTNSAIFSDTRIIYSVVLDETEFYATLLNMTGLMVIITIIGIIGIFILTNLRSKETRLSDQDRFVRNSMHEIQTPLSIITLNNNLRQREFGNDEYSNEIDSALKILQNSYEDMSYITTQDNIEYPIIEIELEDIVEQRIEYFKTIAKANDTDIKYELASNCYINISLIEITRLIDNNLSNAIKYATPNSTIHVKLKDNILSFNNIGNHIHDTNQVFKKYFINLLVEQQGTLVTYEQIDESVYKDGTMSMDALRAMVRRIRKKIETDHIENILEEGYRLNVEKNSIK